VRFSPPRSAPPTAGIRSPKTQGRKRVHEVYEKIRLQCAAMTGRRDCCRLIMCSSVRTCAYSAWGPYSPPHSRPADSALRWTISIGLCRCSRTSRCNRSISSTWMPNLSSTSVKTPALLVGEVDHRRQPRFGEQDDSRVLVKQGVFKMAVQDRPLLHSRLCSGLPSC
jgi:hypothetical protein